MKKAVLKIGTLLIGILAVIPSCDDNNGRSPGDIHIGIATVIPEDENTCSFLLDDGTRLWPASGNIRYASDYNQRVFLNYTVLWDSPGTTHDYDIRVNDIWNILTKEVIELNAENEDSIGNDPVKVEDMWIGGDYLNVSFLFNYGGTKPHLVNLVKSTLPDSTISRAMALEFRHNAYQSTQENLYEGFVCFDLKPFRVNNTDSVQLSIKVKEWNKETTHDVIYRYNRPDTGKTTRIPTPVISSSEYY